MRVVLLVVAAVCAVFLVAFGAEWVTADDVDPLVVAGVGLACLVGTHVTR